MNLRDINYARYLFCFTILLVGWTTKSHASSLQASFRWQTLETERVKEISRLASKAGQQELFLNEFIAFLNLYSNELKEGLSAADQQFIKQLLLELKSQSDRVADVSIYSLLPDSKLESGQNTLRKLHANFNFSRTAEGKVELVRFRAELDEFLKEHCESMVFGLSGQKKVVQKCAVSLRSRESCRHILTEYCAYCLTRHGLGSLLGDPAFRVQADCSEIEYDSAVNVLVSDFQFDAVSEKFKLVVKDYHSSFLELLTNDQRSILEKRLGLSLKMLLQVELAGTSLNGHFDEYIESLASTPTFRKPRVAWLPPKIRTMLLKDYEKQRDKFDTQVDARFYVKEADSVLDRLSAEEMVIHSNLFRQAYRGGWSYLNLTSHGDFGEAAQLRGFELSTQQRKEIRSLYLQWRNDISECEDYDAVVEANNSIFQNLENVLLAEQVPGVFIEGVAANGGLASFVLRPGVSKEINISLQQKDRIQKLRKQTHEKLVRLDLLLRRLVLEETLGELNNEFSNGLLKSLKDDAWNQAIQGAELRDFLSAELRFSHCKNQNKAHVGGMKFDREFVVAFFEYLDSKN